MPFDFHVEEGDELRAAVATVAARFTSALWHQADIPAHDGETPGTPEE